MRKEVSGIKSKKGINECATIAGGEIVAKKTKIEN